MMRSIIKKVISSVCLFSLVMVFLCPSQAIANTITNYEIDNRTERVQKYLYETNNGLLKFNTEEAILNDESEEIIAIGEKVEEIALAYYNYELAEEQGVMLYASIPVYGNYCGPGYGSGLPIDILDAACQEHDQCYGGSGALEGSHSCYCDRMLVIKVRSIRSSLSGTQATVADAIIVFFERKASNPTTGTVTFPYDKCIDYAKQ